MRRVRRLDHSMERLDSSRMRVDNLLETSETGQGSVGKFVMIRPLHDEPEQTIIQVNTTLEDLQRNPSRYLRDMSIVKLF